MEGAWILLFSFQPEVPQDRLLGLAEWKRIYSLSYGNAHIEYMHYIYEYF